MDDTNISRAMDAAGVATRKRRSSILKSQRPPRTPFSELEFNVATPTDNTKSRRVSFSKRTGVAEFATNEATTTWKNFYEEQNKYMELSGNDSGSNDQKAVVSLGRKIFDQQFEEVEAIDLITTMNSRSGLNDNNSMQNINFAPLNMTGVTLDKLTAPQNKFELSTFTDHQSKVFADNLAISKMEVTEGININFSNVQPLSEKDDLDEIVKDIGRDNSNVVCHGPFNMRDMSGYIEVDLNTTHVVMRDDESDMSITDSVHIPKVQDVSKSISIDKKDVNKDWVVDKENIAINPYVAPKESDHFALIEETDEVLVFDGKRLTIQTENNKANRHTMVPNLANENNRKTITLNVDDDLPNFFEESQPNRKITSRDIQDRDVNETKLRTVLYDTGMDISITQALPVNIVASGTEKEEIQKTIVFGNDAGNMSITQVAPRPNDIFSDDADLSLTEVVSAKVIVDTNIPKVALNSERDNAQRRRTILYESNDDISITRAVPGNIVIDAKEERRQTIVFDNDGNMSMTRAIPTTLQEQVEKRKSIATNSCASKPFKNSSISEGANYLPDVAKNKRQTLVFDRDEGNMSVTQALPSNIQNIIAPDPNYNTNFSKNISILEKDNILLGFDDNEDNMSVKQALPTNVMNIMASETECNKSNVIKNNSILDTKNCLQQETTDNKRKTLVFDNDDGNMSVTQALPSNILNTIASTTKCNISSSNKNASVSEFVNNIPEEIKTNSRQTMVFNDDAGNISATQALTANILNTMASTTNHNNSNSTKNTSILQKANCSPDAVQNTKRQTVVYDGNDGNMSTTQVLPTKILNTTVSTTRRSINKSKVDVLVYDENADNISDSITVPVRVNLENDCSKMQDNFNISFAKTIASDLITNNEIFKKDEHSAYKSEVETTKTINFENDGDMSVTQAVPENIIHNEDICYDVHIHKREEKFVKNAYEISTIEKNQEHNLNKNKSNLLQNILDVSVTDSKEEPIKGDISMTDVDGGIQNATRKNQSVVIETKNIDELSKEDLEKTYIKRDITVNKSLKKNINMENHIAEDSRKSIANPIPMEVSVVCEEIVKSKEVIADMAIENMQHNILVYQSFRLSSSQSQLKRTEEGDIQVNDDVSKSDDIPLVVEKELCENKLSTTSNKECTDGMEVDKPISVLDELLNMSTASMERGLEDKYCTAKVETPKASNESMKSADKASNESMFYITRDSDQEAQTEVPDKSIKEKALEYKDQPQIADMLRDKLKQIKIVVNETNNSPPQNRRYEKLVSSDVTIENEKLKQRLSMAGRSFRTADDTGDLLKLLSEYTDKKDSDYIEEEEPKPVVVKGHIAIENKTEIEPMRLSFVPKRQSIVISREDLLHNISMAQATLQKSHFEFDDSDSIEEETNASVEQSLGKKSVRISSEIVKTLHFEDETASDTSIKSEMKRSPLKKTAFGESSYMKESKANVIPTYLKDVSDNLKALMADLVKPVQGDMPFEAGKSDKGVKHSNSTCSTQVQANLTTSSQIDIESNMNSEVQSPRNVGSANTLISGIADLGNRAIEHALKSALKARPVEKYSDMEIVSADDSFKELCSGRLASGQYVPDKILVFDHNNPLNNVLIAPPDYAEVHKYNPQKPTDISASERSISAQIEDTEKVEQVSTQYLVETAIFNQGDVRSENAAEIQSIGSNISKPMSIDESIDVKPIYVKNTEVNTVIAMKGVKQLLEASSSLTLVDDALPQTDFNTDNSSQDDVTSKNLNKVKTIFKSDDLDRLDSDLTSNDEEPRAKSNKRVYSSPVKFDKTTDTLPNIEQQKPLSKMQKISNSPYSLKHKYSIENDNIKVENSPVNFDKHKDSTQSNELQDCDIKVSNSNNTELTETFKDENGHVIFDKDINKQPHIDLKDSKIKISNDTQNSEMCNPVKALKKPNTVVTVQRVVTCNNGDIKSESTLPHTISKSDNGHSVDIISSFTSSKNLQSHTVSLTASMVSRCSKSSHMDWQQETDSRNLVAENDSSVNVVAKIDMLPFMGSADCEWESCAGDAWSFRLLYSLLRLDVRLAHRQRNAMRTRVSADTPVLDVTLHTLIHDKTVYKGNSVSQMCVSFAAEAMRYFASNACACARDVPALLTRCCAVARLACKWGRAMHDARARLAYALTKDGVLTLKVANIALRSVWEVAMRLELVLEESKDAPWPRAADVRVSRIVSDYKVTEAEVQRAIGDVPKNWGHVPRTVWRIFRYLKHKKRPDDFLGV